MQRHCFALDLKDDAELIEAYKAYHVKGWPPVLESIRAAGIEVMDIYLAGNRLFMIMEVTEDFSFEKKAEADLNSEIVQQWEQLMWKHQQALPFAKPGEKWVLMDKIFTLPAN